jgi:RNA polymerase sigma factor (sigma-70 family)
MAGKLSEVPTDSEALPRPHFALSSRGRALLEQNIYVIRQKLDRLSRRSGLPEDEAEEFRSWALFKLVDNDYRILASWQGRSSLSTFLTVVLVNLMRDYRIQVWGKWRPSAAALRQGPVAVLLERLWVRDNLPLDEAIERMRCEHAVSLSRSEFERIAASLHRTPERRRVNEEELLRIPTDGQVESRLADGERARTEERLRELLAPLLRSLPAEDRLLLKLYYWDGLSMAEISRLLRRPQRKLYAVRDKCLRKLRRHLEEGGVSPDQFRELPGCSSLDLAPDGI